MLPFFFLPESASACGSGEKAWHRVGMGCVTEEASAALKGAEWLCTGKEGRGQDVG